MLAEIKGWLPYLYSPFLSMTTMATPLSAVNTILLLSFLSSARAFSYSLVRLGLGGCELLSIPLMSALLS